MGRGVPFLTKAGAFSESRSISMAVVFVGLVSANMVAGSALTIGFSTANFMCSKSSLFPRPQSRYERHYSDSWFVG